MKQLPLLACLISIFLSIPVYGSNKFVIDFRNGQSVSRGEPVNLIYLLERRSSGYAGQRITDVMVYADSRNRRYGGYVQLLDEDSRRISEDSLSNGYALLPVYEDYQRAAFLRFENDVYLNRIEVVTARHLRVPDQERVLQSKSILEIGNFVKTNYKSEVKKFSISHGGFSKINFRVHIGEKHAVIINSILVLSGGRKLGWKTVAARLSNGDNEFTLNVPGDATDIQVSFDHGQGSSIQVFLYP